MRGETGAIQSVLQGMIAARVPPKLDRTIRIGLVGRGIGASLTPVMHEHEGQRLGLDYQYHLLDFDRLGLNDESLGAVIEAAQLVGFAGLNITFPFKQAVIAHLDRLSEDAGQIGAVNTVVFSGGQRIGHNTDCWGFAEAFRKSLGEVSLDRVLQIGAGGAGAAVARALLGQGARVLEIHDTDKVRGLALVETLRGQGGEVRFLAEMGEEPVLASGIVNATPVGMRKYPGSPLDVDLLRPAQWVADVIYFPRHTALILGAKARGCRVMPGGGMAIYQAVRAFELFSGIWPDETAMTRTFEAAAGEHA